ncbi:TIR domain-containing protein [Lysobacter hankyongensis]|uniref:OmpA family protein n=1 Tax=Lysobacter hankyongensis TaxID=1176535 RepID=A0ABP9AYC2_9GAMM
MADVFVSYKKEDRELAQRVVEAIETEGFTVWWDDDITPRESWDLLIEREADAAKALVVLWTPKSVASEWVRAEAKRGRDLSKLIPFMMQPCQLPLAFSMIQAADLSDWNGDMTDARWRKAMDWIADQCGQARPIAPAKPAFPRGTFWLPATVGVTAAALGWAAYTFWPKETDTARSPATPVLDASRPATDSPAVEPPLPTGPLGEAERARRAFLDAPSNPACEGEAALYFDFEAVGIDEATIGASLDPLLERLDECEVSAVLVEGHADAAERNRGFDLASARSGTVASLLVGSGLPKAAIASASFGSERQAVKAGDDIRLAKNRRVVVRVRGLPRKEVTAAAYKALGLLDPADRSQPFSKILFGFDRSRLEGPEAVAILDTWGEIMAENSDIVVVVTGSSGTDGAGREYAFRLGERRAQSVADYLVSIGVEASRIETLALGPDQNPLPGTDVVSRMANRNVSLDKRRMP